MASWPLFFHVFVTQFSQFLTFYVDTPFSTEGVQKSN